MVAWHKYLYGIHADGGDASGLLPAKLFAAANALVSHLLS